MSILLSSLSDAPPKQPENGDRQVSACDPPHPVPAVGDTPYSASNGDPGCVVLKHSGRHTKASLAFVLESSRGFESGAHILIPLSSLANCDITMASYIYTLLMLHQLALKLENFKLRTIPQRYHNYEQHLLGNIWWNPQRSPVEMVTKLTWFSCCLPPQSLARHLTETFVRTMIPAKLDSENFQYVDWHLHYIERRLQLGECRVRSSTATAQSFEYITRFDQGSLVQISQDGKCRVHEVRSRQGYQGFV